MQATCTSITNVPPSKSKSETTNMPNRHHIEIEHIAKRVSSSFTKGGCSATLTELSKICTYMRLRRHRSRHKTANREPQPKENHNQQITKTEQSP